MHVGVDLIHKARLATSFALMINLMNLMMNLMINLINLMINLIIRAPLGPITAAHLQFSLKQLVVRIVLVVKRSAISHLLSYHQKAARKEGEACLLFPQIGLVRNPFHGQFVPAFSHPEQ